MPLIATLFFQIGQTAPVPEGWGQWLTTGGIAGVLAAVLYLVIWSGKLRPEREVLDLQAQVTAWKATAELANQRAEFAEQAAEHIIGGGIDVATLVKAFKAAAGEAAP